MTAEHIGPSKHSAFLYGLVDCEAVRLLFFASFICQLRRIEFMNEIHRNSTVKYFASLIRYSPFIEQRGTRHHSLETEVPSIISEECYFGTPLPIVTRIAPESFCVGEDSSSSTTSGTNDSPMTIFLKSFFTTSSLENR